MIFDSIETGSVTIHDGDAVQLVNMLSDDSTITCEELRIVTPDGTLVIDSLSNTTIRQE